jgi:hypothetical protein
MICKRITFLLSVVLVASPTLRADVYGYQPKSSLHLGGGFDPAHPTEPYTRPCLTYDSEKNIDSSGGTSSASYNLQVISSRQDLYKAMRIDGSLDASYGFFSATGSADNQSTYSSSEDSLTWIAQATVTFGRFQFVNPRPIDKIASLSSGDIQAICGTELVTQETRGVIATIAYTFKNLSSQQKSALSAAVSASASFLAGGGSGSVSYQQALEQASQSSELSIDIEVRGGPGRDVLAKIIGADSDLSQIRAALQTYIQSSSEANASAFEYETSSISQYYPKVANPVLSSGRADALTSLYSSYLDLSNLVTRIQSLAKIPVSSEDQYLTVFVSNAQRKYLLDLAKQYSKAMVSIRSQAARCLTHDADCHAYDTSRLPRVTWPQIPDIPQIVVASHCQWSFPFHPGGPFPPGTKIGMAEYHAFLLGDSHLFDRVTVVVDDNSTPVSVLPFSSGADQPPPRWWPTGEECDAISKVDTSTAFGTFSTQVDLKLRTPQHVTFELRDKFGRVFYLHPPTS